MNLSTIIYVNMRAQIQELVEEVKSFTDEQEDPGLKRAFFRFKYELPVTIEFRDHASANHSVQGFTHNISTDGLYFSSPHNFEPGQRVVLTLEHEYNQYKVPATVIHSESLMEIHKTGVKFDVEDR